MATRILIILTILSALTTFNGASVTAQGSRFKRKYALCPPKFVGIGTLCYYFSTEKANWLDAHFECRDRDSKLAEPFRNEDKQIRAYLNQSEANTERTAKWIGGVYNWERHIWQWGHHGRPMTYQAFSRMQPGSSEDLRFHCAVLSPHVKYRWSSRSCVEPNHFVCEHQMPQVKDQKHMNHIFARWNATFPNQLANQMDITVAVPNDRGRMRRKKENGFAADAMHPALEPANRPQQPQHSWGRPSRNDKFHNQGVRFFYGNRPNATRRHKPRLNANGRPIRRRKPSDRARRVHRLNNEIGGPEVVVAASANEKRQRERYPPRRRTTTTTTTTSMPETTSSREASVIATTPAPSSAVVAPVHHDHRHNHHYSELPPDHGHRERHHQHHQWTEEQEHRNRHDTERESSSTATTTTVRPSTEAPVTTTTQRTTTTTTRATSTMRAQTEAAPPAATTAEPELKNEIPTMSSDEWRRQAAEKKARRDKIHDKLSQLTPEQQAKFFALRKERLEKKRLRNGGEGGK